MSPLYAHLQTIIVILGSAAFAGSLIATFTYYPEVGEYLVFGVSVGGLLVLLYYVLYQTFRYS